MRAEEKGNRIKALRSTLSLIAEVYTLARSGGIPAIDFLNDSVEFFDARKDDVEKRIDKHIFWGPTRIGTELKRKVLTPFVNKEMKKPLLVITITDGMVSRVLLTVTLVGSC